MELLSWAGTDLVERHGGDPCCRRLIIMEKTAGFRGATREARLRTTPTVLPEECSSASSPPTIMLASPHLGRLSVVTRMPKTSLHTVRG